MVPPSPEDDKFEQLFTRAKDFYDQGDNIKALEVIEDLSLVQGNDRASFNFLQGSIFKDIAVETENPDVKFTYWLGSAECFSRNRGLSVFLTGSLFNLAQQLESVLYYKKSLGKAKECLEVVHLEDATSIPHVVNDEEKELKYIIETSESRIAEFKNRVGSPAKNCRQKVVESKGNEEAARISDSGFFKRVRSYWVGLNLERKRNFMKVSTAELRSYVHRVYGEEGRDALEQVLDAARESNKWKFWMCRTCQQKFSTSEECRNHLEQEHAAEFNISSTKATAQKISKAWSRKISVHDWKPVDAVAAVEMIKNRLQDVKAFVYHNGWSTDWPLAGDEERSKLLQEIRSLLVSFYDCKILSCSIRDWVMHFVSKHLGKLEVSKHTLTDCRLVETPQSICFLECGELSQILDFLRNIKCERDDGAHLVSKAVDSFSDGTRVKEKIDFDSQFSFLLLDKRLLQCKIARFDDEGRIDVIDPSVHYAKAHAQGDDILSWLIDYSSGDEGFRFPRPIRTHNLDIWVAVLKAVQFTCRTLGSKYAKKLKLVYFDEALIKAKNLCICEDERRRNIPEDQWNRYASLLCDKCEELLMSNAIDSLVVKLEFSTVRDILQGSLYPTFKFPDSEDSLSVIRERKNISDDIVLQSIDLLKSEVTKKVALIDSKILLIEDSKSNLLKDLTRLSVFDYRSYILRPLKEFLLEDLDGIVCIESQAKLEAELLLEEEKTSQSKKEKNKSKKEEVDGIVVLESKAKVAVAEAELLSKEKKEKEKKPWSIKKNNKSKKRTSTSKSSSPLDQNVEHESTVNLELGVASPSLKKPEEGSMETEDTLSSEMARLEISSNTNNQEGAIKDLQNMPGEDSQSEYLESAPGEAAARYNSALCKTVKALLNIPVLKKDLRHSVQNLKEQPPCALRDFFNAFVSDELKTEGVYSFFLSELLASLEEARPMSSGAAEVVVAILEFWHFWKDAKMERSLVTRLFTLEENETMSCRKCRAKPKYPEQSSYGIVMAADSIRDLKCAFGNIKFGDILKLIRMEEKMLCDIRTGGCGKTNFVHHIISNCPPIFTIVLEWEKNETEKAIAETTKALEWEIDMSRLYDGLEPNTKYRLVSMVGCGEEEEHICLAYKKNRWVSFRYEALAKKVVGNWKSVVRFCGERKVRPEILFYEAVQWPPNI